MAQFILIFVMSSILYAEEAEDIKSQRASCQKKIIDTLVQELEKDASLPIELRSQQERPEYWKELSTLGNGLGVSEVFAAYGRYYFLAENGEAFVANFRLNPAEACKDGYFGQGDRLSNLAKERRSAIPKYSEGYAANMYISSRVEMTLGHIPLPGSDGKVVVIRGNYGCQTGLLDWEKFVESRAGDVRHQGAMPSRTGVNFTGAGYASFQVKEIDPEDIEVREHGLPLKPVPITREEYEQAVNRKLVEALTIEGLNHDSFLWGQTLLKVKKPNLPLEGGAKMNALQNFLRSVRSIVSSAECSELQLSNDSSAARIWSGNGYQSFLLQNTPRGGKNQVIELRSQELK